MTIPTSAIKRDGIARTPEGAVYVQVEPSSTIANPTFTGTSGSGVPFVLAQSWTAVSGAADTNENTLATITVPANALGAHGAIRLYLSFTVTSGADDKTFRVRYSGASGTILGSINPLNAARGRFELVVANAGATNAQTTDGFATTTAGTFFFTGTTAAIDTTAATTLVITVQKETGANTATLNGYIAELIKPSS